MPMGMAIINGVEEGKVKTQASGSDISSHMHRIGLRIIVAVLLGIGLSTVSVSAQQAPDSFRWINAHLESDADVLGWVTRSLAGEKWTSIREIGVEYDAALVVTTQRPSPRSLPVTDTFTIYSVSLTSHTITPLIEGTNLRLVDWVRFGVGRDTELTALYDDCSHCLATTYLTTFYFDPAIHAWSARWIVSGKAAPVWMASSLAEGGWTQAYGVLADPDGNGISLGTWSHFEAGNGKPPEDFFYVYSVSPGTNIDSSSRLTGPASEALKRRICNGDNIVPGLGRGQDAAPCMVFVKPSPKVVTTPPANNHGRSVPPPAKNAVPPAKNVPPPVKK